MRPKLIVLIVSVLSLSIITTTQAAPSLNQAALNYLQNSTQNNWTTQALYKLGAPALPSDHLLSADCSINDYAPVAVCASAIMSITALGEDPREFSGVNLVENLENIYQTTDNDSSLTLNEAVLAIIALRAAGESKKNQTVELARDYIINNQNDDNGWPFALGFSSDTDVTAMAVMALLEVGYHFDDQPIRQAVQFIKSNQSDDGGFHGVWSTDSNANSTAWAISMIYKLMQDPESEDWTIDGASPVSYLKSLQTDEGWFEYQLGLGNFLPVDTTAQVAIALNGGFYPVRHIIYNPQPLIPGAGMILPTGGGGSYVPPVVEEEDAEVDTGDEDSTLPMGEVVEEKVEPEVQLDVTPPAMGRVELIEAALIKTILDPTVYLIESGRKRWIPNETILFLRFPERAIEIVKRSVIDQIPEGLSVSYPNGVYLRSKETQRIYQIKNGQKYHIKSLETWLGLGAEFIEVNERELDRYVFGGVIG